MSNSSNNNKGSKNALKLDDSDIKKILVPDKRDIIKEDPLLRGLANEDNTFDLLDIVLAEMAEEGASLKYERIKKELDDQPTDRLSLRRANILKMVADGLIQKRNLALSDFVNLRSPQWQVVFSELMDKVRVTFSELGYTSEQMELFFDKLQNNLQGFEENTEMKLKESLSKNS